MKKIYQKTTSKYPNNKILCEYYRNNSNQFHGHYIRFWQNYQKESECYYLKGEAVGVPKHWYEDGRMHFINTKKSGQWNSIKIVFNYEK